MKKKQLLALLLSAAMLISMAACAGRGDSTASDTAMPKSQSDTSESGTCLAQELGYGYLSDYTALDTRLTYVSRTSTALGKLYLQGEVYDNTALQAQALLYEVDPATGACRELPFAALENGEHTSETVAGFSMNPDGTGYWIVTDRYSFLPADDAAADTDAVPTAEPETSGESESSLTDAVEEIQDVILAEEPAYIEETSEIFTAKQYDMDGNLLTSIDLTAAASGLEYFYPSAVAMDADGSLLIATDTSIMHFASDGTRLEDTALNSSYIFTMAPTEDGTILVGYYDTTTGESIYCRYENGALSDPLTFEGVDKASLSFYPGYGSNLLASDGTKLYSLNISEGTAVPLLNWLDCDINPGRIQGLAASGEDTVLVLLNNWSSDTVQYELGIMHKTDYADMPVRTVLTLGAEYLDDLVTNAVIRFNRESDTYRISVVDYSVYSNEDNWNGAAEQLDRDVISGTGPDIISLNSGHPEKYFRKGVLLDLSDYVNQDSDLSGSNLLSAPLKAYTDEGKLYGLPLYFNIFTYYASRELAGNRTGWTIEEFADTVSALDPDVSIMQYISRSDFLSTMLAQNLNKFVDYGTASCSFDTTSFQKLLEVCMRLPAEYDYAASDDGMYYDPYQQMQMGTLLLSAGFFMDSYSIKTHYNAYTADNGIVCPGYPTDSGNGALLQVGAGVGISSECSDPDGAWSFVRTLLSSEMQDNVWALPVKASSMEKVLDAAQEESSYVDENGETVYYEDTTYIGEVEVKISPITDEQRQDFLAYLNGAEIGSNYDSEIMAIVTEEAEAYFNGDKGTEEVAKIIQNRVSIYLGETA